MLNREGLDVLVHPLTKSSYDDHRKNALWLGTSVPDAALTNLCRIYCGELPGENLADIPRPVLDSTVDDVLNAARQGDRAAQRAKKLLFENRFRK
jgi:Dopa 4,5-dioxygenase family